MKEIVVVEIIRAVKGKSKALQKALEEIVPLSRASKGCLQYDLLLPMNDREEFLVLMKFKTLEDLRHHENSKYVEEFVQKYENVLYSDVLVTEWKKI